MPRFRAHFLFFLAVLLMAVQLFCAHHNAEYTKKIHKHKGVVCEISLYGNTEKIPVEPPLEKHLVDASTLQMGDTIYITPIIRPVLVQADARAPPSLHFLS